MAADNLVIDSNIFIEYLRAKDKRKTTLYSIPDQTTLFISSVTLYELYMGATTDEKRKDIQMLTEDLTILPFTDTVAIQASVIYHDLRKANDMIEFRDIFIGATCIVYNFPLKTTNTKHFNRIKGLNFS
jgi:tRNA(fMet)-specific endonuclease VapC